MYLDLSFLVQYSTHNKLLSTIFYAVRAPLLARCNTAEPLIDAKPDSNGRTSNVRVDQQNRQCDRCHALWYQIPYAHTRVMIVIITILIIIIMGDDADRVATVRCAVCMRAPSRTSQHPSDTTLTGQSIPFSVEDLYIQYCCMRSRIGLPSITEYLLRGWAWRRGCMSRTPYRYLRPPTSIKVARSGCFSRRFIPPPIQFNSM